MFLYSKCLGKVKLSGWTKCVGVLFVCLLLKTKTVYFKLGLIFLVGFFFSSFFNKGWLERLKDKCSI